MKASERKKNKFKVIQYNLEMIRLYKKQIRFFYPLRNQKGALARWDLKRTIQKLHCALFVLYVMEKQIKMPVRITVTRCVVVKPRRNSPTTECRFIIHKKHCCPRCEKELRLFDANDEWALLAGIMQPKYCPYCG